MATIMRDDRNRAKNLRLALILASIAAAIFIGFLIKQGLLAR